MEQTMNFDQSPLKWLSFSEKCEYFTANYNGNNFLNDLALFLAQQTGVFYVLIGFPENSDMLKIRTAVLLAGDKFIADYSYELSGTPCENVMGRNCCYYPSGIQQMFPKDLELKHLGIESYIGLPINSEEGNSLGLIALMDNKVIQNPAEIERGLSKLSGRVLHELSSHLQKSA